MKSEEVQEKAVNRPRLLLLSALLSSILFSSCNTETAPSRPTPPGEQPTRLHTEGPWIRDQSNRTVILRGINVGSRSKLPPFLPFEDLHYLDQLVEWGMNSIRLVFTWEGVEPLQGQYDETYLDRIEALLDGCAARRILVMLDAHQDLYARNFCGDGFPEWAVHPDYRSESCPEPFELWPVNYVISPGVSESFSRFWSNQDLKDAFIRMWFHLADRFGTHPAVVAFDLLNEPYDASYWRFDGDFERDLLMPFYRDLILVLQASVPDILISYGTTGLFSLGLPTYLETLDLSNIVFGAHWYDALALFFGSGSNLTGMRERLEEITKTAGEWGVPVYIGEYGVPTDNTENIPFLAGQIDLLEEFFLGSAIWAYNPTDLDWNNEATSLVNPGGGEKPHVSVFVRPYPARVAGTPAAFHYDGSTGTLLLTFRADTGATGPTEIVVPTRNYPGGFQVEAEDGKWEWNAARMRLSYYTPQDGDLHTLRLLPAGASE